jgi:hypothetical protein
VKLEINFILFKEKGYKEDISVNVVKNTCSDEVWNCGNAE